MVVLKYNANGLPLWWFDTETGKLWRRVDKNSSENKRCPQFLKSKVDKLRLDFLSAKPIQQI